MPVLFRLATWSLVSVVLVAFRCTNVVAADGSFDPSFANGGRTTFNLSTSNDDYALSVRETSSGKLLVMGNCDQTACLAQLLAGGGFDTSYGPLGFGYARFDEFTATPPAGFLLDDALLLPDGRAALAGTGGGSSAFVPTLALVRADGTGLDTSVGHGMGYFTNAFASNSLSISTIRLTRQADGKFLLLGQGQLTGIGSVMLVSRVLADLSGLDPTFGTNGVAQIAFNLNPQPGQNQDFPRALAIQQDGKIIIGGIGTSTSFRHVLEFARLLGNGQRDPTYGAAGDGRIHYSNDSVETQLVDLTTDASGRIVFGGSYGGNGTDYFFMIGRLTVDGAFDSTFHGGLVTFNSSNPFAESVQSIIVTNDSILTASYVERPNTNVAASYFRADRFDFNGNHAPDFGLSGSAFSSFASVDDTDGPSSILLTERGLVLAGFSATGSKLQFGLARLQYEHLFGSTFE